MSTTALILLLLILMYPLVYGIFMVRSFETLQNREVE